mgnify:CR=1 FL=1
MSNYRKTMTEALKEMYSLDERMTSARQLVNPNKEIMIVKKNKVIVIDKKDQDKYMKQGWSLAEEVKLDESELVELDEYNEKSVDKEIEKSGIKKGSKEAKLIHRLLKGRKGSKKEEVELDEGKMKDLLIKGQDLEAYAKKSGGIDKKDMMKVAAMLKKGDKSGALKYTNKLDTDPKEYILSLMGEEVDLEEAKISASQISSLKKAYEPMRGKKISMKSGEKLMKIMDKVDDDKQALIQLFKADIPFVSALASTRLISKHNIKGAEFAKMKEEVELDEASARSDARRAMRADPDMRQKFSKDVSATDDDKKGASKNIMMQMRKAQSLKGRFDVEFQDGKKVKIPAKMAIAVQQKYNKMRRPAEKEKFQAQVAKSYKSMLSALKEGFASDAQRRAAFASGYKEKGKKNKKESVLGRIDKKLKEKNDG